MVCCEWVVISSAFAADVAVCGEFSDAFCLSSIVSVIQSVVMSLTVFAACDACGESAAVQARSPYGHARSLPACVSGLPAYLNDAVILLPELAICLILLVLPNA